MTQPEALPDSGIVVADDGRALTTAHVVDVCTSIRVAAKGPIGMARLPARDPTNDGTPLHTAASDLGRDVAIEGPTGSSDRVQASAT